MKFKLFLVTLISLFISTQSFANTLVCQKEISECSSRDLDIYI